MVAYFNMICSSRLGFARALAGLGCCFHRGIFELAVTGCVLDQLAKGCPAFFAINVQGNGTAFAEGNFRRNELGRTG